MSSWVFMRGLVGGGWRGLILGRGGRCCGRGKGGRGLWSCVVDRGGDGEGAGG